MANKASVISPHRADAVLSEEEYQLLYRCSPHSSHAKPFFAVGFGYRPKVPVLSNSATAWAYIVFCVGRGERTGDNGNKALPTACAEGMFLFGTDKGEEVFKETPHDVAFMKRNATNTRVFRLHELLSEEQFKQLLRRNFTTLKQSKARAEAKEEEARLQHNNPLRKAVFKASTKQLLDKWAKIRGNHVNRPASHLLPGVPERRLFDVSTLTPLATVREFVYSFVIDVGQLPEDQAVFNL